MWLKPDVPGSFADIFEELEAQDTGDAAAP
jgi:hypothetical protein